MEALKGKGFFIWNAKQCSDGDPFKIQHYAKLAGLKHVIIKIADGVKPHNVAEKTFEDFAKPIVKALQDIGITVWGWQYIYGNSPEDEAEIAIARIMQTNVTGFVVNAESQFKTRSDDPTRATNYMKFLRFKLEKTFPIGLSTYRFPHYHREFPFVEFLTYCDYVLPQIYWINSHDPILQLEQTLKSYDGLSVKRPIIPTGSAYNLSAWTPTIKDINDFLIKSKSLGFSGANFWSWEHTERIPILWEAISSFSWPVAEPEKKEDPEVEKVKKYLKLFPEAQVVINLNINADKTALTTKLPVKFIDN